MSCCCSRSSGRKLAEPKKRRRKRRRRPPKRGSSGKEKIDPRSPTKSCLDVYRRRRDEGERNEGRLWEKRTKREERREKRRRTEGSDGKAGANIRQTGSRAGISILISLPFYLLPSAPYSCIVSDPSFRSIHPLSVSFIQNPGSFSSQADWFMTSGAAHLLPFFSLLPFALRLAVFGPVNSWGSENLLPNPDQMSVITCSDSLIEKEEDEEGLLQVCMTWAVNWRSWSREDEDEDTCTVCRNHLHLFVTLFDDHRHTHRDPYTHIDTRVERKSLCLTQVKVGIERSRSKYLRNPFTPIFTALFIIVKCKSAFLLFLSLTNTHTDTYPESRSDSLCRNNINTRHSGKTKAMYTAIDWTVRGKWKVKPHTDRHVDTCNERQRQQASRWAFGRFSAV